LALDGDGEVHDVEEAEAVILREEGGVLGGAENIEFGVEFGEMGWEVADFPKGRRTADPVEISTERATLVEKYGT
jgi:hypothetical protein